MTTSNETAAGFSDDDAIVQRVLEIVLEQADVDRAQVAPDTRLYDIMDSLELTETVMELEDEFEASIPDDDVGTIQTVGQLIEYVKSHFPAPREKEQSPP
jgi:acyl carrier protein